MKAIQRIKKMVALGMGLTMVGATIMGASALNLNNFPAPFIIEGTPASNLVVVVGEHAAASDIIGLGEIAAKLQQEAKVTKPVQGSSVTTTLTGDSFQFSTSNSALNLFENPASVRSTVTASDLKGFGGTVITTDLGTTEVEQTGLFNSSTSTQVTYGKDDSTGIVDDYLYFRSAQQIMTLRLSFKEGFKLAVDTKNGAGKLSDATGKKLPVVHQKLVISEITLNTNSSDLPVTITAIGGKALEVFKEGDSKQFTVNGEEITVRASLIKEQTNEVIYEILKGNELVQRTDSLKVGELFVANNGFTIAPALIDTSEKNTQSSEVLTAIEAYRVRWKDTNTTDTVPVTAGLTVNDETPTTNAVIIQGTLEGGMTGVREKYTITKIDTLIYAESSLGDIFVPEGHGVSEYIKFKESLIVPGWDITYQGLTDTGVEYLKFVPRSDEEYMLNFVANTGKQYTNVPLLTSKPSAAGLWSGRQTSGGEYNALHTREDNSGAFFIKQRDFFVVNDLGQTNVLNVTGASATPVQEGDAFSNVPIVNGTIVAATTNTPGTNPFISGNSDDEFTAVLQLSATNSVDNTIDIVDLATGLSTYSYDGTSRLGEMIIDGTAHSFYADDNNTGGISVDLNGDGVFTMNNFTYFTTKGKLNVVGPVLNPHNASCQAAGCSSQVAGTAPTVEYAAITVHAKNTDAGTSPVTFGVQFFERTGSDEVTLNRSATRGFNTTKDESLEGRYTAMTQYGQFAEFLNTDESDHSTTLVLENPLVERTPQVFISVGPTTAVTSGGGAVSEEIVPLQVGFSKLDSEVANVKDYNAIVVGGPCANSLAAELMGNPSDCVNSIPANKALLKLVEHSNGNVALIVAGRDALNTRQAARALATGKLSEVNAKEAVVSGTSLQEITVSAV